MRTSVLVVEPDNLQLKITTDFLEHLGYVAVPFDSSYLAIDALKGVAFDVLLTSIILEAETNGMVLAAIAKQIQPQVAVVIATGGVADGLGKLPFVDGVLTRPFLVDRLRGVIDAARLRCTIENQTAQFL